MADEQPDAAAFQPLPPGTQQGRGLHDPRKHTARGADDGFGAEPGRPAADIVGAEGIERRPQALRRIAEPHGELFVSLAMRDVQAGFSRQQEFAADRRHGFEDGDRVIAFGQPFRRHQAGRPAADDRDLSGCHRSSANRLLAALLSRIRRKCKMTDPATNRHAAFMCGEIARCRPSRHFMLASTVWFYYAMRRGQFRWRFS